MITKRQFRTVAAVGGLTAAIALLTGLPGAQAGELQANPDLQQRVDQLAQAMPHGAATGGFPYLGSPTPPPGVPAGGGSFPRSFLIPGTDTSIRIGGQAQADIITYFSGMAAATGSAGESLSAFNDPGATGNLGGIPLNGSQQKSRSGGVALSTRESKINVETRTPTPWGEARTFIEFDFNQGNGTLGGPTNPNQVSSSWEPRLRFAYATLGPLLVGQANSNFEDSDSQPEELNFGGATGYNGPSRHPQIRYTWAAPWAIGGALSVAAEQPATDLFTPYGYVEGDSQPASFSNCAQTATSTTTVTGAAGATATTTTTINNIGQTCLSLAQLNNPAYQKIPDFTMAYQLPQPWGHFNLHGLVRELSINDGKRINKDYLGYGIGFGVDVKPGWFGWTKDNFTSNFTWGQGAGYYIADSAAALATNYATNAAAATAAGAASVRAKLSTNFGGHLGYQHWWLSNLRSTADFSIVHTDLDSNLINTPAIGAPVAGSTRASANKELVTGVFNLIWSPVAFVDIGAEYVWGHRVVVNNTKGDAHSVEGVMRVKF